MRKGLPNKDFFKEKPYGYRRPSGRVGVRNRVGVMAAADNVNPLVRRLSETSDSLVCLTASYGRGQLGKDLELYLRTMGNLAAHPNLAGCLIVSFEPESAARISEQAVKAGGQVQRLSMLVEGGMTRALERGHECLAEMLEAASAAVHEPISPELLTVGLECGGSDATSGIVANPALGLVADALIDSGGTAVFSEPVECLGCEALLKARVEDPAEAARLVETIKKYQEIALEQGVDLTGVNPTSDNIAGGLSTIEEKSLGAVSKAGSASIKGVLAYGEAPAASGLWFMDAPAAAVENLTALVAGGCQAVMFSTGSVNPVGHPLAPTLKICANPEYIRLMGEHVDVDLSPVITGEITLYEAARRVAEKLIRVINGELTAAERTGFIETRISRIGRSV
ncbi:MAG: UxaA family hydrolase [Deltaproteobacteria bacterium]|nr:UxaA family hydrolase [Deltaproteobacteria bacterium]